MKEIVSVIERMKVALSVSTDSALAKSLGLKGSGTVSSWKTRGSIPFNECLKISQNKNISLDWLISGEGAKYNYAYMTLSAIKELADKGDKGAKRMIHRLGLAGSDFKTPLAFLTLSQIEEKAEDGDAEATRTMQSIDPFWVSDLNKEESYQEHVMKSPLQRLKKLASPRKTVVDYESDIIGDSFEQLEKEHAEHDYDLTPDNKYEPVIIFDMFADTIKEQLLLAPYDELTLNTTDLHDLNLKHNLELFISIYNRACLLAKQNRKDDFSVIAEIAVYDEYKAVQEDELLKASVYLQETTNKSLIHAYKHQIEHFNSRLAQLINKRPRLLKDSF